jgi:hypothetical protein
MNIIIRQSANVKKHGSYVCVPMQSAQEAGG